MKESQPVLMTDQAFQTLVEKVSIVFFQKSFLHQATFNRWLKTMGGCYYSASHHLDLNSAVSLKYGQEELERVIKHGLCHYHLHLAGKDCQHKDRNFKELLAKTGGARYVPPLVERKRAVFRQHQCQFCGEVILRRR